MIDFSFTKFIVYFVFKRRRNCDIATYSIYLSKTKGEYARGRYTTDLKLGLNYNDENVTPRHIFLSGRRTQIKMHII